MKCRCCGREISVHDKFCNYCGENNDYYGKEINELPKEKVEPKIEIKPKIEVKSKKEEDVIEILSRDLITEVKKKAIQPIKPVVQPEAVKVKKVKQVKKIKKTKRIKIEPLTNLLVRKDIYSQVYFNTKMKVPSGVEVFVYKDGYLHLKVYEGGEEILNKRKGLILNSVDPSSYKIYTLNTHVVKDEKWGTRYPIPYEDKEIGTTIQLSAFGSYNYSISDPEIFISKVIGDQEQIYNEKIGDFLQEMIQQEVTIILANKMTEHNYFELYTIIKELSAFLYDHLNKKFNDFGIRLKEFVITSFKVEPEWVIEEHRRLKFNKNVLDFDVK